VVTQEPPVTNSYFVLFNSQTAAAAAAQCCIFPEGAADAFRVMSAPGPEEASTLCDHSVFQYLFFFSTCCFM
jgi:hypothetical protein